MENRFLVAGVRVLQQEAGGRGDHGDQQEEDFCDHGRDLRLAHSGRGTCRVTSIRGPGTAFARCVPGCNVRGPVTEDTTDGTDEKSARDLIPSVSATPMSL